MFNRWTTPLALRLLDRDSMRFDARYGVETATWMTVDEMAITEGDAEGARPYVPTPPRLLRALLRAQVPDPRGWTFVDFGSGRGRALIIAARYGFRRVVGVEFGRELHEAAARNVDLVRDRVPRADRIELVLGDATRFELPDGPLVLFFNNPFIGDVFDAVATNIEASYRADPRPILVLYQTMKVEDPGQGGEGNLERLERSADLRPTQLRLWNPLDALALRPFVLRGYSSLEALGGGHAPHAELSEAAARAEARLVEPRG